MKELHYVIFDGTSAFVGGKDDIKDNEVLFKHRSLSLCESYCDNENEKINGN